MNELSYREREIIQVLATTKLTNREVANQFFVTEKTVKFHIGNIYKKLGVNSREELTSWYLQESLAITGESHV